jgi:cysteinyl-tRNA synthetase
MGSGMDRAKKDDRPLKLYNSLANRKQAFVPLAEGHVKMFTCGPSIYDKPHLGNYRAFLYEDVLQRYLEYLGYGVERLLNFTDVEDKSIAGADKKIARLWATTEASAENFFQNCGLLHIKVPDFIPRSSTSIDQAVRLIGMLMDKGYAYWHGRDVFYDPLRFPGFGRLYGLDMNRWPKRKMRYRRDNYAGNRWNRGDFILWHGYRESRDGEVYWETELGKGRPAWNVQDPAMISKHLGYRIDIACGGVDNLYRHHDYTIAVIEGVSGEKFANFWLHGEHVLLNGKKMSKSKGNIVYPKDLLGKEISAAGIRYFLIRAHYRQKLNLTDKTLVEKEKQCQALRELARQFIRPLFGGGTATPESEAAIGKMTADFKQGMNDDLDVRQACRSLASNLRTLEGHREENGLDEAQIHGIRKELLRIDGVLQILFE